MKYWISFGLDSTVHWTRSSIGIPCLYHFVIHIANWLQPSASSLESAISYQPLWGWVEWRCIWTRTPICNLPTDNRPARILSPSFGPHSQKPEAQKHEINILFKKGQMFQDMVSHKGCRKIRLLNYRIVSFSDIWIAKVYISWSMVLILDFIWIWFQICILYFWMEISSPPSEAAPSLV